ncbi:SRPBCC family protein [Paenibacillus oryzisoli]|uniref:Polyketide cyclase n=1 Tax=Paenibacillus oryzisoli TaxID=1850517 RepID=A0A198A8D3_9BACL|nr:SRPBCC family protein [Paenibacillus oryzisoli]OAS17365.1 polyketide cyclase [Paenibacillus oryzisoli]
MTTIRKEIALNVSPEHVWDAVKDVGAFHLRLVPGYTENTLLEGNVRTLILPNGDSVRELIVAVDDNERRMVFAVKEGRMPLLHHNASFQVFPNETNSSTLVWTTDFLPEELGKMIQDQVDRVSEVMKHTIEAAAKKESQHSD